MRVLNRREELLRQARRQPEVVVDQLLALEQQVEVLQAKVRQLEDRQALNSSNSSQPPASEGLAKPPSRSLRQKTGRCWRFGPTACPWGCSPPSAGGARRRHRGRGAATPNPLMKRKVGAGSPPSTRGPPARRMPQTQLVEITDREGDLYELHDAGTVGPANLHLLVRAQHDRQLDCHQKLWAFMRQQPWAKPANSTRPDGAANRPAPRRSKSAGRASRLRPPPWATKRVGRR